MGSGSSSAHPPSRDGSEGVVLQPARLAATVAALYLAACALYIAVSSHWAAERARTIEDLERIETVKGILFVAVCAALLFGLCWWLLQRVARGQAELLRHRSALIEAERRGVAGVFASSVAHDMNNILTVGVANADLLRASKGLTPDQTDLVRDIEATFVRLTEMTRRLSGMGRQTLQTELEPGDLAVVVREELAFARRHARLLGCQIQLTGPASLPMRLQGQMLQQMLVNLLLNAAEATEGRGRIEVRIAKVGDDAVIEVHDNGPGVPADQAARIFDPFVTTKERGLGLGLLSARAAAQVHRGRIAVDASPMGGACFRITLPITV